MKRNLVKIAVILLLLGAVVSFFIFDLKQYLTLESLKAQQDSFAIYNAEHPFLVFLSYSFTYIIFTAFSLPAAAILTLLGGALFGFLKGTVIVSFSSSIGATLAFLMARFVLKDWVQEKYGHQLAKINEGFEKEGAFYLFALRLVPVFPFFAVNLLTSLLPIKAWTFYWVSQLGMLAATGVYVYAGTQLATLSALNDIASPNLIIAFVLLGLFPLASKKILTLIRKKKHHG